MGTMSLMTAHLSKRTKSQMIKFYSGRLKVLVTSGTKIQMTYLQRRKTYLSLKFMLLCFTYFWYCQFNFMGFKQGKKRVSLWVWKSSHWIKTSLWIIQIKLGVW